MVEWSPPKRAIDEEYFLGPMARENGEIAQGLFTLTFRHIFRPQVALSRCNSNNPAHTEPQRFNSVATIKLTLEFVFLFLSPHFV